MLDWFAISFAEERGYTTCHNLSWVTDAEFNTSFIPGTVLWSEVDDRYHTQSRISHVPAAQTHTNSGVVLGVYFSQRKFTVQLYGSSWAANAAVISQLKERFPPAPPEKSHPEIVFWYETPTGPQSYSRKLEAPTWDDISSNYAPATKAKLIQLRDIDPAKNSGKLILWQGEPGTGKTFALRSLAEDWSTWCKVHYVLDPEKFFSSGQYLLSVVLGESDDDESPAMVKGSKLSGTGKYKLIVLEDAGEMLSKDAKIQVGQGLSRLLNLCDGLLGQGLRIMVLITTNEHVGTLHEAVSRPGRCLSSISFDKFDPASGNEWLKTHGAPPSLTKSATLAELFALTNGAGLPVKEKPSVGFGVGVGASEYLKAAGSL